MVNSMEEMAQAIRKHAADGKDFGCECYYCGCDPLGLVNRGDAIPVLYGSGEPQGKPHGKPPKWYCFRCSEDSSHITDPIKKAELNKAFGRGKK